MSLCNIFPFPQTQIGMDRNEFSLIGQHKVDNLPEFLGPRKRRALLTYNHLPKPSQENWGSPTRRTLSRNGKEKEERWLQLDEMNATVKVWV